MRFGSPHYFWLLLALPALAGFFLWAYQRRRQALHRFAAPQLWGRLAPEASRGRQVLRWVLWSGFFVFAALALTRPRFGVRMEMVERTGVDVVVALDISESMLAEDITPNRLERAKHETAKFIDMLKGDRFGLVIFAGESYVQCPLTLDYGAAKMFLGVVSTGWIQTQGTALAQAMRKAIDAFAAKGSKSKVLILITDGEDHEGDVMAEAGRAASAGIKIYTIGVGSESGVPIPLRKGGGDVVYKKDKNGNLVLTKLDQVTLEKIAAEGKGKYFHVGTDLDFAAIYSDIMKMEKGDIGVNRMSVFEERYQAFLLIALALLLAEFFLPERKRLRNNASKNR